MNEEVLIVTGRFQPLHKGHIMFLHEIRKKYPTKTLIICILRISPELSIKDEEIDNNFINISTEVHAKSRNPLPNWERFRLLNIAIRNDPLLSENTFIIFRDRPELNWANSLVDLPPNRIWVFNSIRGEFDVLKVDFYKQKSEKVIELIIKTDEISGSEIRKKLKNNVLDLSFLPEYCHEYFKLYCLKY